jgi:hypothetical protein
VSKTEQRRPVPMVYPQTTMSKPVAIRRHAILKHHYRRAVAGTPNFHDLDGRHQWAALREQVVNDAAPRPSDLLAILDSREPRRDEVLSALKVGRVSLR